MTLPSIRNDVLEYTHFEKKVQRYFGATFGERTILYGCAIAVGCTPTLYGLWQTFREMR